MAIIGSVAVTTATVGGATYVASRDILDDTWSSLAQDQAARTTEQALRMLDPARTLVDMGESLVDEGKVDPGDMSSMLDFLTVSLASHPTLSWFTFARARDGVYGLAFRDLSSNQTKLRRNLVLPTDSGGWSLQESEQQADGSWLGVRVREWSTDPRQRPFYLAAAPLSDGRGIWTDPYLFLPEDQLGISFTMPSFDAQGQLRGVWTADAEASPLSQFLARLEMPDTGRAYIVDDEGRVIGHPDGIVVDRSHTPARIWTALDHPDQRLRQAWQAISSVDADRHTVVSQGDLIAMQRFPPDSGIRWTVLTVVSLDALYARATRQLTVSWTIALVLILAGLLVAGGIARRFANALSQLERAMLRVADFDLAGADLGSQPTSYREVLALRHAHDTMKRGLRSFGRHVPKQLVAQLLQDDQERDQGGETRDVTVMFANVADYGHIAEQASREEIMSGLSELVRLAQASVGRHDGVLGSLQGDAIMAFWGAPQPRDDHAMAACAAALRLDEATRRAALTAQAEGRPALHVQIGLQSGTTLAGNIGSEERLVYALIGDAVNTAARLEKLHAQLGTTILLGDATARAVRHAFLVRPVARVQIKGKDQPLLVWELLGMRDNAPPQVQTALEETERGLDALGRRNFEEAVTHLERAVALLGPADIIAAAQVARARALRDTPPPADWDDVICEGET
jgi:adenylate cyclase